MRRARLLRRIATVAAATGLVFEALTACSDTNDGATIVVCDAAAPPDAPTDVAMPDSSPPPLPDAATDSASGDLVESRGSTGVVEIANARVDAYFFEDETILRDPAVPECVAYERSTRKPFSKAGLLVVTSELVGTPDGPPLPLELLPGPPDNYIEVVLDGPPFLFKNGASSNVQLEVETRDGIAGFPLTTLRSPEIADVQLTAPTAPDGGRLTIASQRPFEVTWTPPAAGAATRMIIDILGIAGISRAAEIRCEARPDAGRFAVPASLLSAIKGRVDPVNLVDLVTVRIRAGDRRELTTPETSFVLEVASSAATTDFVDVALE